MSAINIPSATADKERRGELQLTDGVVVCQREQKNKAKKRCDDGDGRPELLKHRPASQQASQPISSGLSFFPISHATLTPWGYMAAARIFGLKLTQLSTTIRAVRRRERVI
ncbi:hypothetical protein MGYG_09019 [Nannizzia gypsea CBS 118893]|uniref:Uncharacterized protein n=1 Tax=Arthroderma gypseum (strain ATCC MYA-4604 / CBS 118893) TaxID=535722 RepID=E4US24_ARTGP|nr:hypothetical protein MGYG_09019 [Nannizzia gypsea CBS 118893]EFR00442.1 hypothetical protein MGYG_09019 [Nannizzia gypsea CBS 118893]